MTKVVRSRPTATEAAKRLVILKHVIVYALITPPRDYLASLIQQWSKEDVEQFSMDAEVVRESHWKRIREPGLWEFTAPSERAFAETTAVSMTHQQQVEACWRAESACVLMWSLGLISNLPPFDEQASHEPLKSVANDGIEQFVESARLRDSIEVDKARDDAELWHWRSRTRQLIEEGREFPADDKLRSAGYASYDDIVRVAARKFHEEGRMPSCIDDDFVAFGKPFRDLSSDEWSEVRSILMERHFALNWLCGYAPDNQWDLTPTDT